MEMDSANEAMSCVSQRHAPLFDIDVRFRFEVGDRLGVRKKDSCLREHFVPLRFAFVRREF